MIRQLHINNYKSLFDLTLEVGRFNVLIGENGCGKSNILEAITFAGAAAADKLDNEFLVSRGIRVTDPQLMRSAFNRESDNQSISIDFYFRDLEELRQYTLINDNQPYSKWICRQSKSLKMISDFYKSQISNFKQVDSLQQTHTISYIDEEDGNLVSLQIDEEIIKSMDKFMDLLNTTYEYQNQLSNFLIYSPENTALRNFTKEGQIEPLGINGEGLLKLLKVIQSKSPEQREAIHTTLQLFDWYDNIGIPKDLASIEDKVTLTDHYLSREFDQRSANEGFLFVLFYIALMVSDDTPKIFAIDNIDVALNPKLCTQLIKELVHLAKQYDKQVFVTTHNPAILDGIDLGDDEQRLLVVSRNKQGHTRVKRITVNDKPRSSGNEDLKLSEAFLRGYLGGLPKGF